MIQLSGDMLVYREYHDPVSKQMIQVEMTIRDHLYLKYLNDINTQLLRGK